MYENPIIIICQGIQTQMVQRDEQMIFEAIQKQNVFIDKEELIKAMNYDRNQYSKGYKDGVSDVLSKIKAEFIARYPKNYAGELELDGASCEFSLNKVLEIINEYKTEGGV